MAVKFGPHLDNFSLRFVLRQLNRVWPHCVLGCDFEFCSGHGCVCLGFSV